jgi:hypothetical protein
VYATTLCPWIYIQQRANEIQGGKIPVIEQETAGKEYFVLSSLYVLAENIVDQATKKLVLDAIEAHAEVELPGVDGEASFCYPEMDSVRVIYAGSPSNSPCHQLLVRLYTDYATSDYLSIASPSLQNLGIVPGVKDGPVTHAIVPEPGQIDLEDVSKDFLYDLSTSLLNLRPRPAVYELAQHNLNDTEDVLGNTYKKLADKETELITIWDKLREEQSAYETTKSAQDENSREV